MASRRTNGSKSNWQRRRLVLLGGGDRAPRRGLRRRRRSSRVDIVLRAAPLRRATSEITIWHGYGELAAPGEEPNTELDSLKAQVDAFQVGQPEHQGRHDLRQLGRRAREADGGAAGRQGARRHLPVRHQPAAARDLAEGGRPDRARRTRPTTTGTTSRPASATCSPSTARCSACPALVDNLAVVYNKDLFQAAGLAEPKPDWTWDELVADAKALTDGGEERSSAWSGRSTAARPRSGSTSRCCGRPAAT